MYHRSVVEQLLKTAIYKFLYEQPDARRAHCQTALCCRCGERILWPSVCDQAFGLCTAQHARRVECSGSPQLHYKLACTLIPTVAMPMPRQSRRVALCVSQKFSYCGIFQN